MASESPLEPVDIQLDQQADVIAARTIGVDSALRIVPPPDPTESGQSQWQLVWKQFRRRRLAVASAGLILFLFTVSVFAPFIANGTPFYYYGFNRFEYQEALRNARALLDQLGKEEKPTGEAVVPGKKPENRAATSRGSKIKTIERQISSMKRSLKPEKQAELQTLSDKIAVLGEAGPANAEAAAELAKIRSTLRQDFDVKKVELVNSAHWPIFASLVWGDIAFMVFNVLLLLVPIWGPLVNHRIGTEFTGRKFRTKLAILLGVPLLCGGIWWLTVPQRVDRTRYKSEITSERRNDASPDAAANERLADVKYEKAVWPLIPYALDEENLNEQKLKPSLAHWMGTDDIGRDVMSRMVWGGRVSLAVGVVSVSIYVTIGVIVGAIAGYFRGWCDLIISRIIEIVICFPSFFLILTIVAFFGQSIFNIMLVIGLIGWTGVAQLVRGEFLRLGEQEFILAGRALGFSPLRIIFRHVLPNALAPVLVSATFGIAGAILTESALSFLGFGITVPRPSWGGLLSKGRDFNMEAPWMIFFPGFAIFLTITAYNLVGEALRDAADPRLRGSR